MTDFSLPKLTGDGTPGLPDQSEERNLETARDECEGVVATLAEKTPGFGKLPAERYLLRFEYGFSSKELAEEFGVSLSTISKQTRGIRRHVLEYPSLSRIIGQFRVSRSGLEAPDLSEETIFDSSFQIEDKHVDTQVTFQKGNPGRTFSWRYRLQAAWKGDEANIHQLDDYLIDVEFGVVLRRRTHGVSGQNDLQSPRYRRTPSYTIYALPHTDLPVSGGTLRESLQYHMTQGLVLNIVDEYLEENLVSEDFQESRLSSYSDPDTLLDRLSRNRSTEEVEEYSQERHFRHNLEHLLRVYPLEEPLDLPSRTIDLIWNGSLDEYSTDGTAESVLESALEGTRIVNMTKNKGY